MTYNGELHLYTLTKIGLVKRISIMPHIARSNVNLAIWWKNQKVVRMLLCQIENLVYDVILATTQNINASQVAACRVIIFMTLMCALQIS
jgi:hypothetical protein